MKALKYYLAVEKLKHFQYRANDVLSLKDLSLLISEVKSNIYRHDFLRNEYETRLTSFKKYRDEHMEELEFLYDSIIKFINQYYCVYKKLEDGTGVTNFENCRTIPQIYYFPNLRFVMGAKRKGKDRDYNISDVTPCDGIKNFYVRNISKYIHSKKSIDICEQNNRIFGIEQFITENVNEIVLNTVDFYALKSENYYLLGNDYVSNDEFFKLWLNSALIQVINSLITYTLKEINNMPALQEKMARIEKKMAELTPSQKEVAIMIGVYRLSTKEIANERCVNPVTVSSQIREIENKFEIKGGKKGIIELFERI